MSDEFMSPMKIDWMGADKGYGTVKYGNENSVGAVFYLDAKHNPAKSKEKGSEIYDNVAYVRIGEPGDRLNIIIRPATEADKRRWPIQWNQFLDHTKQRPSGTPIALLYPDQPAVGKMLEAYDVFTVEQCATLSAHSISNIGMGCQTYVNAAQRYLEVAKKGVSGSQLRQELDERDAKLRVQEQQIHQLQATVDKLMSERGKDMSAVDLRSLIEQAISQRPVNVQGANFDPQQAAINANGASSRPVAKKKDKFVPPPAPAKTKRRLERARS